MKKLLIVIGMLMCATAAAQVIVSERNEMNYDRPVFGTGVSRANKWRRHQFSASSSDTIFVHDHRRNYKSR